MNCVWGVLIMATDFEKWLQEICEELGYNEDEIHKSVAKFESMSIDSIYEALDAAENNEREIMAEKCIDDGSMDFDYIFDDYFERFNGQYFEEYPDEKKRWDEDEDIDNDLFINFMKKYDYYDDYIHDMRVEAYNAISYDGSYYHGDSWEDQIRANTIETVSKDTGLPYAIIKYLSDNRHIEEMLR